MSSKPALAVARGSTYLIANSAVNMVVSIGAFAIIARIISPTQMGEVAVLLLITAGATLLGGLGVTSTATKFVASYNAMDKNEEMRCAGYGCLVICLLATAVIVGAIYLSANMLAIFMFGDVSKANLLKLLTLEIVAVSVRNPLTGILTGLKRFKEISLTSVATFTARQLLVVALLGIGLGVPGMVIAWGVGDSLCSLALFIYTRKFLGPPRLHLGLMNLVSFSLPLLFGDAASYAWTWFDRALLIPTVTLAQLGAYNVAVTAFGILDSLPSSISGTLFPYYADFYPGGNGSSKTIDLENAVEKASRYLSFFTIPLSIGLAATALPAATLLAGSDYAGAAYPLAVLSISLAIGCFVRALSQIFVVLEKVAVSGIVSIASAAISVLIGIATVHYLGILGASLARGASLIIALALSLLFLRRMLKLRFDIGAYRSVWVAGLLMAGSVLIFQTLLYSKYLLPLYVAVGGLVFILALRPLHAVNQEDIQLLSDFLNPKLRFIIEYLSKVVGVEKTRSYEKRFDGPSPNT